MEEEDKARMFESVAKEELLTILKMFQKDKSPNPDRWTIEFFIGFFDLFGDYLLRVVKEIIIFGKVPENFNSTLIEFISTMDYLDSYDGFKLIALCNCIYKIVSKFTIVRLKPILFGLISYDQFQLLKGYQIHEAVGAT